MRPVVSLIMFLLYFSLSLSEKQLTSARGVQYDDNDEDEDEHIEIFNEDEINLNKTDKGMYLGSPCEFTCSPKLLHVFCNPVSGVCECDKRHPVKLNPATGCGKPKRLGEQCYYREACKYSDQHASCVQIHHNAVCQCKSGYHIVSIQKPSKRVFCAEDVDILKTDFSTLAGVLSGIAVLSGLICFVLKLFNQNRYTRPHRFGNANLAPPIFFSNDTGIGLPMPLLEQSSTSHGTSQRSLTSVSSRRASSLHGCRGISVSASRAGAARAAAILLMSFHEHNPDIPAKLTSYLGSRRPSLTSIHSTSSVRSFSARRFEREKEQKEEREMQRRFARIASNGRAPPTPSPRSTDELLPTLAEDRPVYIVQVPLAIQEEDNGANGFNEEIPSTSKQFT
ncbi:hypothetical protein RI129_000912 [Pyrocoelia pectoralis]|uniref:Uncharacterized protein n=1 Tax=Pyrocoelia pectoralis TaxID=417401 RepID=A0AAN7ZWJ0_9COLE